MAEFRAHKIVSSLPDPLEANSVYFVRVGAGFDVIVTNSTGTIVPYALNQFSGNYTDLEGRPELGTAAEAEITDFAPSVHGHTISDVSGLQSALDTKATIIGASTFRVLTQEEYDALDPVSEVNQSTMYFVIRG